MKALKSGLCTKLICLSALLGARPGYAKLTADKPPEIKELTEALRFQVAQYRWGVAGRAPIERILEALRDAGVAHIADPKTLTPDDLKEIKVASCGADPHTKTFVHLNGTVIAVVRPGDTAAQQRFDKMCAMVKGAVPGSIYLDPTFGAVQSNSAAR
ncbi:MAG: hypothetical protein AB7G93_13575 [Bdellovibrionales bacterium]